MTLLNLLRNHLDKWPEGVIVILQDPDGSLRCPVLREEFRGKSFWVFRSVGKLELADDYETAFVTEDMWNE